MPALFRLKEPFARSRRRLVERQLAIDKVARFCVRDSLNSTCAKVTEHAPSPGPPLFVSSPGLS
jgi:hypothetical protein